MSAEGTTINPRVKLVDDHIAPCHRCACSVVKSAAKRDGRVIYGLLLKFYCKRCWGGEPERRAA